MKPVAEYMERPFPVISEDASLTEVTNSIGYDTTAILRETCERFRHYYQVGFDLFPDTSEGEPMSNEADPILEAHRSFVAEMKNGDVAKLTAALDDGIVFMPPADGTIIGKVAIKDWYDDYFKYFQILSLDITDRDVSRVGDCIVERIALSVSLEPRHGGDHDL